MKIKKVSWFKKDLGLLKPYSIAYKTVSDVSIAVFKIELANGLVGIGTSNPSKYVVNQDVDGVISDFSEADFSYIEGSNIEHFHSLVIETREKFGNKPGSHACVDIALYDCFTKFLKVPIGDFLGRRIKSLPTSVTVGIMDEYDTLQEVEKFVHSGFKCIKVKTGLDPENDASRVNKINEKFPEVMIRVDANQGYGLDELNHFIDHTSDIDLELIEQPFPTETFKALLKEVPEHSRSLIAADESIRNPKDAVDLIKYSPECEIFNIKLMKSGGIYNGSQIASIADLRGISLMWGCNDESNVSISAALNLAMSYNNTKFLDLDGSFDLKEDLVTGGITLKNGCLYPVSSPGLGVEMRV